MGLDLIRNSPIRLLTMALVWVTGLTMGVPVLAADKTLSAPYALGFKGKVGTWSSEAAFELVMNFLDSGKPAGSLASGTFLNYDQAVTEIRPNGNRVVTNRATRVRRTNTMNGSTVSFDSDNPGELASADSDPTLRPALALLNTTVTYVRDSRGRLVDYTMASDDQAVNETASANASDTMARDAMVFPAGPLRIGQSWAADQRDLPFGEFGSLQFTVKGTLSRVETRGLKTHALITFTSENPVFAGAGDFRDVKLLKFSYTASGEYDFEAGRMIVMEQNERIELGSDTKGAPGMKAEVRASSRDTGTDVTAWMVAPTPALISGNPAIAAPAGADRNQKDTRASSHDPLPEFRPCFGPDSTAVERIEACSAIIKASGSRPGSVDTGNLAHAFFARAMGYAERSEMGRAEDDMEAAIKLNPDFQTFATRAELHRFNKKYELAIADADRAITLDPSNVHIRLVKALSLSQLKRTAEALRECNEALLLAPKDPDVYGVRGVIKTEAGDKAGGEADRATSASLEKK